MSAAASEDTELAADEKLTFSDGQGKQAEIQLTAGSTIGSAVQAINDALTTAGIRATASFSGGAFHLTNSDFGSETTVTNTVRSDLSSASNSIGLVAAADTDYNIAREGNGRDVAGTIGGQAATGRGRVLTADTGTALEGMELLATASGSVTIQNNVMNMQVGGFAGQVVQLSIEDLRSDMLGRDAVGTTFQSEINVRSIDVTAGNGAAARDAVRIVDDAISQATTVRATLGAFLKNALDATLRTNQITSQNILTATAQIRDADLATEQLELLHSGLLQDTSQAVMSQTKELLNSVVQLVQRTGWGPGAAG